MEHTGVEIARLMAEGVEQGLAIAAAELLETAKAEVPVGTADELHGGHQPGELRDSGRIEVEFGGRVVTVSFNTPYAAKIHEALQYQHPHGGKARYLEDPLKAMIPRLEGIVARPLHKLFTGRRDPGLRG